MKILILLAVLTLSSCSLIESAKKPIIGKAAETAKKAALKVLGCNTGEAVYADVSSHLNKEKSSNKSIAGTVCILSVGPIVSKLLEEANGKLPASWIADGCSLNKFEGDAKELAVKLCSKL